jgi:serine/threonine-protein kinase HipA
VTNAKVKLWGRTVGAVSWDESRALGVFEYNPKFLSSSVEISPIVMPKSTRIYEFPGNRPRGGEDSAFNGLPGLLADSIPDKFGNALIDSWLIRQGRSRDSMNPVERLCYVGKRGMGALEFEPAIRKALNKAVDVEVALLVELANEVLGNRLKLSGALEYSKDGLQEILRVGTSAGGARAKAVLAWNPQTNDFKSGQLNAPPGYEHWLLKFDGVESLDDHNLEDTKGYGRIEYGYYLLARECGIHMMPSRLHEESGRAHFMTKRFDREGDTKRHVQSLCALRHYDYNLPRVYSYEQAVEACRMLNLGMTDIEQLVRRAYFNILARNQDDHTKNIAFIMDKAGTWSLSPAYDITYAFNPDKFFTREHQMSLNGKTEHFVKEDLVAFGQFAGLKKHRSIALFNEVGEAVQMWPAFAKQAGVKSEKIESIKNVQRAHLLES